jgi:hypothetical protein
MAGEWSDFWVATVGAAAALTGLLFIAVSLRPAEIRESSLMAGRARSAFYGFASITIVALLALAGTSSRLVGVAQLAVAAAILAASAPFTIAASRARSLNVARALIYHAGLVTMAVGGALRAFAADPDTSSAVLAAGVLLLLGIAISNSWQLVISHPGAGGASADPA